jgi:Domain of unknown function (DUF4145)
MKTQAKPLKIDYGGGKGDSNPPSNVVSKHRRQRTARKLILRDGRIWIRIGNGLKKPGFPDSSPRAGGALVIRGRAFMLVIWMNQGNIPAQSYTCGHCNAFVGSSTGFIPQSQQYHNVARPSWLIYICPNCGKPTFVDQEEGKQVPGSRYGDPIDKLPKEVKELYEEARACMPASAYTSVVLTCRKILMHVAVEKGAKPGENFISYVEYLSSKNYLPPDGKDWVDHIRKKGNEANHDIVIMSKTEAEELLTFVEMLLKFVYEFPAKIGSASGTTSAVTRAATPKTP